MSSILAARIGETRVEPGSLAIFWLGQAGFVYKTPAGKVIYIDPYLTDSVHRQLADVLYGFKRIMMAPLAPDEVEADLLVCTHSHPDHLDVDLFPVLVRNPRIHFAGAPDCRAEFAKQGVPADRYTIMERGVMLDYDDFRLTPVYADHGDLAPDALGVVLQVGDIKVWQVGDSAYRPDMWQDVFAMGIDVLAPPINGAFGNLDDVEAAKLARDTHARMAIPCHFWMFAEHGGSPIHFLDACKEFAPDVKPYLMSVGELLVYKK